MLHLLMMIDVTPLNSKTIVITIDTSSLCYNLIPIVLVTFYN